MTRCHLFSNRCNQRIIFKVRAGDDFTRDFTCFGISKSRFIGKIEGRNNE